MERFPRGIKALSSRVSPNPGQSVILPSPNFRALSRQCLRKSAGPAKALNLPLSLKEVLAWCCFESQGKYLRETGVN